MTGVFGSLAHGRDTKAECAIEIKFSCSTDFVLDSCQLKFVGAFADIPTVQRAALAVVLRESIIQ